MKSLTKHHSMAVGLALASLVPAGLAAQAAAPAATVISSWTSDAMMVAQGDLITILIDEYTIASADRNESAVRERGRDVSVATAPISGGLRTRNDVLSRTRGESARRERFVAEITTRIVEILPGGTARIEGTKTVQIDDHEQTVTVRGLVRTQDVSVANTVESWRVADAELLYDSNESLGKAGGIWSKLLDMIIP